MEGKREVDVLVLGGGPAGSSTAALLRTHHPNLRVMLVEAARFPRYHIGESLVLEVNRVLAEMGVLEEVDRAGFLVKGGATYVWGKDRKPWSFAFAESTGRRPHFQGLNDYTYHVERARFDAMLLERARTLGVEVLQPARCERVLEEDGRVVGAVVRQADVEFEVRARFVVDATGRAGVLAKERGTRVFDPVLRNVATFGYFRGAKLEPDYNGDWEVARICIISHPAGWIWYIPMERDVVSVGVVTSDRNFRDVVAKDPEAYYRKVLRETPETARFLADAELVSFHNAPRKVLVETDFNYFHDKLHGPGYALVGDAAGFLDPLFTFGVFLSVTGARLLTYALGSVLDGTATEEAMLTAYESHMRTYFESFRAMLYTFYGFNTTKEDFWAETRERVRSHALPEDMSAREAFMSTTFGFVVNSMLFHECIQHFGRVSLNRIRDMLLSAESSEARPNEMGDYQPTAVAGEARPRLRAAYAVTESAIPFDGTGRMVPMARVDFALPTPEGGTFPRHFYMPIPWTPALASMDGTRTVDELVAGVAGHEASTSLGRLTAERFLRHALGSMGAMGLVEFA